jgi:flagellum-specific ATP synthase
MDIYDLIDDIDLNKEVIFGYIKEINGDKIKAINLKVSIGDFVYIQNKYKKIKGVVTSVTSDVFVIILFGQVEGFTIDDKVFKYNHGLDLKISNSFNGRILNGLGVPIDGNGAIKHEANYLNVNIVKEPIAALSRQPITEVFETGVKAIDGILTVGKGQKMGIFAGSGVGKSTLLSMITKNSKSDIKVIALIGERGREVSEFIEQNLNNDLTNIILIVATSDESPIMRKYAAYTALTIAEYFRDTGNDVLFILDSITRVAIAQREIGIMSEELPVLKGYTPSVFTLLPQLLERIANINTGTMTGFFTVLVDGDDMNDPIADQTRSILDGHIILNRKLTEQGVYPPIDILKSASRVVDSILEEPEIEKQTRFRRILGILEENKTIINIGSYQRGSNKEIDFAIMKKEALFNFIKQGKRVKFHYNDIKEELTRVIS